MRRAIYHRNKAKNPHWLCNTKPNATSFRLGHIPWNKGKSQLPTTPPPTRYSIGQRPHNWCPIGTITTRYGKRDKKHRHFIKVAEPNRWEEYAIHLWEQRHGTMPHGTVLHHIDRDTLHDSLDNLQLLTRSEHMNVHRTEIVAGRTHR